MNKRIGLRARKKHIIEAKLAGEQSGRERDQRKIGLENWYPLPDKRQGQLLKIN